MELNPCLFGRELPVNRQFCRVASRFPGRDFAPECFHIWQMPVQALPTEHRQLNLGHVQPQVCHAQLPCLGV